MSKRYLTLFATVLISSGLWFYLTEPTPRNLDAEKAMASIEGKHGDFIFRKGRGIWSPLFAQFNADSLSHVGVIFIENGQRYVLHSEADDYTLQGGVQKTLEKQFKADSAFYVVKSNTMPAEKKKRFMQELVDFLVKHAAFDSDFELTGDPNKLYCTEYVWRAAEQAGVNLGEPIHLMGKEYITIDAILNSTLVM